MDMFFEMYYNNIRLCRQGTGKLHGRLYVSMQAEAESKAADLSGKGALVSCL